MKSENLIARIRTTGEYVLTASFVIAICLPIARMLLSQKPDEYADPRYANPPAVSLSLSMVHYPHKFKDYFQNRFGFREELVRWNGIIKVECLGVSPTTRVMLGEDGWLFFTDEGSLDSMRCSQPYTQKQLRRWKDLLQARNEWLKRQGVHYCLMVMPDKHTVYGDYVPDCYTRLTPESRLDQFTEYLSAHSDVAIIDLRKPLAEASRHAQVYYKTDTHWNVLGGFVAYRELSKRLQEWYPEMRSCALSDFHLSYRVEPPGDMARLLGLGQDVKERTPVLEPNTEWSARATMGCPISSIKFTNIPIVDRAATECPTGQIPSALVLRDSACNALMPFIAQHFRKAAYVWLDPRDFPRQEVERQKPDVVIQVFAERKLMRDPLEYDVQPALTSAGRQDSRT